MGWARRSIERYTQEIANCNLTPVVRFGRRVCTRNAGRCEPDACGLALDPSRRLRRRSATAQPRASPTASATTTARSSSARSRTATTAGPVRACGRRRTEGLQGSLALTRVDRGIGVWLGLLLHACRLRQLDPVRVRPRQQRHQRDPRDVEVLCARRRHQQVTSWPNVVCHPPIVLHALGLSSSLLLKSFFFTPCGPTPPMWRVVPSCLLFFWASALNSAYKKNASAHVRAACFMPSSAGMWVSEATIPLYRHIDPRHSRRDPAPPAQRASTKPRHMTANVLPVSGGQVGTTKRVKC